jgi:hypothetical protein
MGHLAEHISEITKLQEKCLTKFQKEFVCKLFDKNVYGVSVLKSGAVG